MFIAKKLSILLTDASLKEFVKEDKDCNDADLFITYIFGKENKVLGIARMRTMSFGEFKDDILEKKMFNLEEIEEFSSL